MDNELVALPADGSTEPRLIASGHDFYAAPRFARRSAARLDRWDHPRMPWDGTELWVAELDGGTASSPGAGGVGDRAVLVARTASCISSATATAGGTSTGRIGP